jgi:hypothetical protein
MHADSGVALGLLKVDGGERPPPRPTIDYRPCQRGGEIGRPRPALAAHATRAG